MAILTKKAQNLFGNENVDFDKKKTLEFFLELKMSILAKKAQNLSVNGNVDFNLNVEILTS